MLFGSIDINIIGFIYFDWMGNKLVGIKPYVITLQMINTYPALIITKIISTLINELQNQDWEIKLKAGIYSIVQL
jgi:hypothetical protein